MCQTCDKKEIEIEFDHTCETEDLCVCTLLKENNLYKPFHSGLGHERAQLDHLFEVRAKKNSTKYVRAQTQTHICTRARTHTSLSTKKCVQKCTQTHIEMQTDERI